DSGAKTGTPIFEELADSLMFRDSTLSARVALSGTRTPAALREFARGQRFVERWDLAAADSEFAAATRHDVQYGQAYLWLAQVRVWTDQPTATWRVVVQEESRHRARLSRQDQLLTDAPSSLAAGHVEEACATLSRLS